MFRNLFETACIKKTFMVIGLLLISTTFYAQRKYAGFKAGGISSNFSKSDKQHGTDARWGFSGGLTYERNITRYVFYGVDFIFAQRGAKYDGTYLVPVGKNSPVKVEQEFKYSYFTLPVRIGFIKGKNLFYTANGGIVPGLLSFATVTIPGFNANKEYIGTFTINDTEGYKKFDLSAQVEFGAGWRMTEYMKIGTSVCFQRSLSSFNEQTSYIDKNAKHISMSFNLFFQYALDYDSRGNPNSTYR